MSFFAGRTRRRKPQRALGGSQWPDRSRQGQGPAGNARGGAGWARASLLEVPSLNLKIDVIRPLSQETSIEPEGSLAIRFVMIGTVVSVSMLS